MSYLLGKTLTTAICTSDDVVHVGSATVSSTLADGESSMLFSSTAFNGYVGKSGDKVLFQIRLNNGASVNIKWIALYEGEYTIDTLPEYQPRGYENELLVCRQYNPKTGKYIGLRKFGQPRNLLDNSNFTNPVNQRGGNSWNSAGYFIDRWTQYSTDASKYGASLVSGGLKCNNDGVVRQNIPDDIVSYNLVSADYTIVLWATNGTVRISHTGLYTNSNLGVYVFTLPAGTWAHAALYEGIYTTETLPEYQSKGYAAELMECQRYYLKITGNSAIGAHITSGSKDMLLALMPPIEMRINPTVKMNSVKFAIRTVSGYSSIAPYPDGGSPSSASAYKKQHMLYLCFTYSSAIGTNNTPASAQIVSGDFELIADI